MEQNSNEACHADCRAAELLKAKTHALADICDAHKTSIHTRGVALNPLHTPDIVEAFNQSLDGGYLANKDRRTGRTTAIALSAIAESIRQPRTLIPLIDHHPARAAALHLAQEVVAIIHHLRLQEMTVFKNNGRYVVCFGASK